VLWVQLLRYLLRRALHQVRPAHPPHIVHMNHYNNKRPPRHSFNLSLSRQFGFTSAVKDESVKVLL
jgi:hypothetical protein